MKAATRKTASAVPAAKVPARGTAAKAVVASPKVSKAKPVTKAAPAKAVKPVAKKAAPAKTASKAAPKVAAKAPSKSSAAAKGVPTKAKAPRQASAAPTATRPAKPVAAAARPRVPAPAPKAVAAKVAKASPAPAKASAKPASKVATPKVAVATKPRPAPAVAPSPVAKSAPVQSPASSLPKVGATIEQPAPMGKRAARKVMMDQMSQPEVLPTHAPDAAKATFSAATERVVTMPTAQASAVKKDPKRADNWKKFSLEELTDADILSMPDSEYMNEVQLAYFRRKLSTLRDDMLANAGETTEHLREDTVVVPDPADRATIEEEHALELRTRDRERKLLKKIEQSLARIDANDYGYCDETGEAIGVARLLARPTASLSLEAQQRRELKQKMFGD